MEVKEWEQLAGLRLFPIIPGQSGHRLPVGRLEVGRVAQTLVRAAKGSRCRAGVGGASCWCTHRSGYAGGRSSSASGDGPA